MVKDVVRWSGRHTLEVFARTQSQIKVVAESSRRSSARARLWLLKITLISAAKLLSILPPCRHILGEAL